MTPQKNALMKGNGIYLSPMKRCDWCLSDPLYIDYHDKEWGVPQFEDNVLFEFLCLEGMQAGLSWITVLRKRESMRRAFKDFDPHQLAKLSEQDMQAHLQNPALIRNRLKIAALKKNAVAYLKVKEQQSFSDYLWQFTDGKTIHNRWKTLADVPANTATSDVMAKTLKKAGFSFVGSTICYALMQATGMVNDHLVDCHRYRELRNSSTIK